MVVAEIPLWVTHNMDSPETGTHPSHYKSGSGAAAANGNNNGTATTATSTGAGAGTGNNNNNNIRNNAAAVASLALLQEEKKKCAIYAVDVHPSGTKFATAGGDGTVRLWSTATLFLTKHKGGRFQYVKPKTKQAPTTTTAEAASTDATTTVPPPAAGTAAAAGPLGGYVSTTASSGSSSSSTSSSNSGDGSNSINSSGNSDDDASHNKEQQNGNRSSSSSSSSSESSSVDNNTTGADGSATETSSVGIIMNGNSSIMADLEEIHDLNDVVRRKKDGESAASPPRKQVAMNNNKPPPTSPWKGLNQPQQQSTDANSNINDNKKQQQQHHHHHRLLCTLSAHTGSSVLAIRFSNTGNFLASAGDDGCVCLYAPTCTSSSSSAATALVLQGNLVDNGGAAMAVEHHWSRIALCRGHNLDVVGLAWAPDDSHLVSCSLDRETPIIVWKLTDLTQQHDNHHDNHHHHSMIRNPYKILGKNVHTSTVKGVTFDPAGSYLASSGDDPAVCIWRAHDDWGLEKRIDAKSGIFRQWKNNKQNQNKQQQQQNNQQQQELDFDDDTQALSSQSLFRRISWSTDGAFICSTNSVVKNKHVASTISRQGWAVAASAAAAASSSATAAGAANLVGHRQPVVVSRHAAQLLAAAPKKKKKKKHDNSDNDDSHDQSEDDDDADADPEYATLLALGDKRGFVTVWSTRKSRPIFKLQCSETRCTVTDLAWGRLRRGGSSSSSSSCGDNLILLVSLLDGQVVALKFDVPKEIGPLLSPKDQARVFALRYGIDMDDAGTFGQRRLLVGEDSGRSQFLENALQINLENTNNNTAALPPVTTNDNDAMDVDNVPHNDIDRSGAVNEQSTLSQQTESRSKGGKKRVQPVLINMSGNNGDKKRARPSSSPTSKTTKATTEKQAAAAKDPLERAMNAAERASAITETTPMSPSGKQQAAPPSPPAMARHAQFGRHGAPSLASFSLIPHSTERIHSVDLPVVAGDMLMAGLDATATAANEAARMTAECTNSSKIPYGSKGASLPCTDVTISRSGRAMWRDQITGTSCSAMAASPSLLVVGTSDGTIQLFATSPTLGWNCGNAFRSHPPLVVGQPVVALQAKEMSMNDNGDGHNNTNGANTKTLLLVLTADGSFGVYSLVPDARVLYKGSIMPAMTHISLGLSFLEQQHQHRIAKLSRIQITESGRLLLLLSLQQQSSITAGNNGANMGTSTVGGGRGGVFERGGRSSSASASMGSSTDGGTGGSLQAFVYNQSMELWMRLSDSKFVLSDFYSSLPSLSSQRGQYSAATEASVCGPLSRLDDAVRMGALDSALKPSLRGRSSSSAEKQHQAAAIYSQSEQDMGTFIPTRSHCEDRMACALALGSAVEFRHWLSLYARVLAVGGYESLLRMLVDMLMGTEKSALSTDSSTPVAGGGACWWLTSAPQVLGLDRKNLVRSIIVREMSKNRALQRTTNEIALELDS